MLGVYRPNSTGHAKAWESITPTPGATPNRGIPWLQLEGPCRRIGVHHPYSRGHIEAWKSITPTRGTTPRRGSSCSQLEAIPKHGSALPPHNLPQALFWPSRMYLKQRACPPLCFSAMGLWQGPNQQPLAPSHCPPSECAAGTIVAHITMSQAMCLPTLVPLCTRTPLSQPKSANVSHCG